MDLPKAGEHWIYTHDRYEHFCLSLIETDAKPFGPSNSFDEFEFERTILELEPLDVEDGVKAGDRDRLRVGGKWFWQHWYCAAQPMRFGYPCGNCELRVRWGVEDYLCSRCRQ